MVKGYGQKLGIDFNEMFAPIVKHRFIKIVLSLVANMNLELEQITTFLRADLDEEIDVLEWSFLGQS